VPKVDLNSWNFLRRLTDPFLLNGLNKGMKILLISPDGNGRKKGFSSSDEFLNLPYVAASPLLVSEVKIVDEAFEKVDFGEKVDLVGITAQTPVAPRAYQIADEFKKRGIPVVMEVSMPACFLRKPFSMWMP